MVVSLIITILIGSNMLSNLSDYKCKNADSILKPPSKCYRPLRIYNKYIQEVVYVDCGKCSACLHKKSAELTNRVASEVKQHLYSLFFTLTYDNEHLPVILMVLHLLVIILLIMILSIDNIYILLCQMLMKIFILINLLRWILMVLLILVRKICKTG